MATFKPADVSRISDAETRNVLAQMQENLNFMFGQLGAGNFNSDVWDTLTATPTADEVGALASSGIVAVANGGQGNVTLPLNRLLYGSDTDPVASLAFPETAGSLLCQGTSGVPYWSTPSTVRTAIGAQSGLSPAFLTPSSINVATATDTVLTSMSLSAGTYLLLGYCHFVNNNTGVRGLSINDSAAFNTIAAKINAADGWGTGLSYWRYIGFSADTTMYLTAYQNSGSTLTVTQGYLLALKIG